MQAIPLPFLFQLHVLDVGGGTGNYTKQLLDKGVGKVTMIDGNQGMLDTAKTKLQHYVSDGKLTVQQAILPEIPFPDNQFDAVMINQVFHHLDDPTQQGENKDQLQYPNVAATVSEIGRVLKPGGIFLTNTCSHIQIQKGFWYNYLLRSASVKAYARKYPIIDQLVQYIEISNMVLTSTFLSCDPCMNWDEYTNLEGMLSEQWRGGDSVLGWVGEDEVQEAIMKVEDLKKEGKLREFFESKDLQRKQLGQSSFLVAKKVTQ